VGSFTHSAVARGNRIYGNAERGVVAYLKSTVADNQIYSHRIAIETASSADLGPAITGNVIYDNSETAIRLGVGTDNALLASNTIYALQGDGIQLPQESSHNVTIKDNVLYIRSGIAIHAESGRHFDFVSDYNLIYTSEASAIGSWAGVTYTDHAAWYYQLGLDRNSLAGTSSSFDPQFQDVAGPDGLLGYSELGMEPPIIVDDGDLGFSTTEPWEIVPSGYRGDSRVRLGTGADDAALWTIGGLTNGATYVVSTTWIPGSYDTAATFSLADGTGLLAMAEIDQTWDSPDDFYFDGVSWERLAVVRISGDTLTVRLQADSDRPTLADAIHVQRIQGDFGADDDFRLQASSPAIDAADPSSDFSHELAPNGSRRNIGAYGNTPLAAVSGDAVLHLLTPGPFSKLQHGQVLEISWNSTGPLSTVNIELFDPFDGAASEIASGLNASDSYQWTVPSDLVEERYYHIRISSSDGSQNALNSSAVVQIANGGTRYYINDSSTAGDSWTTTAGDNGHSGKSPDHPMADLNALLRVYDLGPGDTVFVDAGVYDLRQNIELYPMDSGITIVGVGESTILDRNDRLEFAHGLEMRGADDVTIKDLVIRNAYRGVYAAEAIDSDRIQLLGIAVEDNTQEGVRIGGSNDGWVIDAASITDTLGTSYAGVVIQSTNNRISNSTIHGHRLGIESNDHSLHGQSNNALVGNQVFDNAGPGILASSHAAAIIVADNSVYNNRGQGIFVLTSDVSGNTIISGNTVRDNRADGIHAEGDLLIADNTVYSNDSIGIRLAGSAHAMGNVVFGNAIGIHAGDSNSSAAVSRNRVFNNTAQGILAVEQSVVEGNSVYSNSIGIHARSSSLSSHFQGEVSSNLVYSNTIQGVLIDRGGESSIVNNNTIYQQSGDAIRLVNSTRDLRIANNIVQIESGVAIHVEAGSTTGIVSDHNLFHRAVGSSALVGVWGGNNADRLSDWQTLSTLDGSSLEADPLFVDIDGADNVLGYDPLGNAGNGYDGGEDDNFFVRQNSPAIDRGHSWWAAATDLQRSGRLDDPDTINAGTLDYSEHIQNASGFIVEGRAGRWQGTNRYWTYQLPFSFPLFDQSYNRVYVTSNGFLQFGAIPEEFDHTATPLGSQPRIAVLWDALSTSGADDNIFIDQTVAGRATIRWDATNEVDGSDVNFSVTLFENGRFEFHYGAGNQNLSPTIGFSGGHPRHTRLASIHGATSLANHPSLHFEFVPGMADLGAHEFRGESSDSAPPVVVSAVPAASGKHGPFGLDQLRVTFSEELNSIDANASAAYQLISSGANGLFGDGDDIVYLLRPSFETPNNYVDLQILAGALAPGEYRFSIPSGLGRSIHDTAGLQLDGDADGVAGGDFHLFFQVEADVEPPRVAAVIAASSEWPLNFVDAVDDDAAGASNGLGLQLLAGSAPIAQNDVDRIYVQFSEAVTNITEANFELRDSLGLVQFSVEYDPINFRATLALTTPLAANKYRLAVADSVTDQAGNFLDGDGSGVAGGIFDFRFDA
jgi:parallel beta-helix repeat protein